MDKKAKLLIDLMLVETAITKQENFGTVSKTNINKEKRLLKKILKEMQSTTDIKTFMENVL